MARHTKATHKRTQRLPKNARPTLPEDQRYVPLRTPHDFVVDEFDNDIFLNPPPPLDPNTRTIEGVHELLGREGRNVKNSLKHAFASDDPKLRRSAFLFLAPFVVVPAALGMLGLLTSIFHW